MFHCKSSMTIHYVYDSSVYKACMLLEEKYILLYYSGDEKQGRSGKKSRSFCFQRYAERSVYYNAFAVPVLFPGICSDDYILFAFDPDAAALEI